MTDSRLKRLIIRGLESVMPYSLWLDLRFEMQMLRMRVSNEVNPFYHLKVRSFSDSRSVRVHLACGARYLPGWINFDGPTTSQVDLKIDLRRRLPLPDHVAEMIFCEHFVEHLPYPDAVMFFLKDCLRVLRPDGVLRVSVPDAGRYLSAYAADDRPYFDKERPNTTTHMEAVNHVFRQGGQHKFAYDYATLADLFQRAGFERVERAAFNRSRQPWFDSDSPDRAGESLYVEGIRAAGIGEGLAQS
jgi:predicted SAM-dependent methyltransferase